MIILKLVNKVTLEFEMLVLSSKVKYAIAALMELVDCYEKGLLQSKVIAERRSIPPNYLEQLLNQLTRAGIVRAVRGSKGGYELAVPPEDVTFLQVCEVMEGCLETAGNDTQRSDAVHDLHREAEQEVKRVFSVSLRALLARQQARDEMMQESLMFHI